MVSQRPVLVLPKTSSALILEGLAIAGLVALCVVAIHGWLTLPDRIPVHFGIDGKPNNWGGKSTIWLLPLLGLLSYGLTTILARFPHTFNYAVQINQENAPRQYQIACSMLAWLKTEMLWLYAYIEWQIVSIAAAQNSSLGIWFLPVALIVIFGTIGHWLWQSLSAK